MKKLVLVILTTLLFSCGGVEDQDQGFQMRGSKIEGASYNGIEVDFNNCKATQNGFWWPHDEVITCNSNELTVITRNDDCTTIESFRKVGLMGLNYSYIRSGCANLLSRMESMGTGGVFVLE